jgi:hypothetical protein
MTGNAKLQVFIEEVGRMAGSSNEKQERPTLTSETQQSEDCERREPAL